MNKTMGVVVGIIGIVILMVVFPIVMSATHDLQTDPTAETHLLVVTGVGVTTADVVLVNALWSDDTAYVTSITSNNVGDTPVKGAYAAATQTLTVTGLKHTDTRTLVITFETDALTDYTGMGALVGVTPLLIWVSILGAVLAGLFFSFKGRGN